MKNFHMKEIHTSVSQNFCYNYMCNFCAKKYSLCWKKNILLAIILKFFIPKLFFVDVRMFSCYNYDEVLYFFVTRLFLTKIRYAYGSDGMVIVVQMTEFHFLIVKWSNLKLEKGFFLLHRLTMAFFTLQSEIVINKSCQMYFAFSYTTRYMI